MESTTRLAIWDESRPRTLAEVLHALATEIWLRTAEPRHAAAIARATARCQQEPTEENVTQLDDAYLRAETDRAHQAVLVGYTLARVLATARLTDDLETLCQRTMERAGLRPLSRAEIEAFDAATTAAYGALNAS